MFYSKNSFDKIEYEMYLSPQPVMGNVLVHFGEDTGALYQEDIIEDLTR